MTETDKVSTAPEDVEAFCKHLAGSCGNHPICHEAAATLRALSAEVERLKAERVPLAEFAWKHIGEDLMAMTPQEAVAAFNATQVK